MAARPTRPARTRSRWRRCGPPPWSSSKSTRTWWCWACWLTGATSWAGPALRPSTGSTGCCWNCSPGGAKKFLSAAQARALIAATRPRDIVGKTRRRLIAELITELEGIDRKIKACKKEIAVLVEAQGSTLLQLHGIGPSSAARLLADVGNIHRFASRDHFASWNGTAPLDASSGQQQRHRLSRAGNRRINRALHIMAVVQLRNPTEGRAYYDARKAAGKTSMEAMRCLKRRLSNVVYRQMLHDQDTRQAAGPGGHSGTTLQSSVTDLTPDIGSSDKPLPGPATSQRRTPVAAAS
jgi:hypothetical protein